MLCNQRGLGNCASVKIKNIDTYNGGSGCRTGRGQDMGGIKGAQRRLAHTPDASSFCPSRTLSTTPSMCLEVRRSTLWARWSHL